MTLSTPKHSDCISPEPGTQLRLSRFRVDVTPPTGHPLCGGWLEPAVAVSDHLYALGVVLIGYGKPVVLCVVDWCEIANQSHIAWRMLLADAGGTTPDRVAVHTMHPHCTPWPDQEAQRLVAMEVGVGHLMDPVWCDNALNRVASAVRDSVRRAEPFTHVGLGKAKVDQVASNRRIIGDNGKIKAMRLTRTPDPLVRAEPEGLIDPWLKTISFWNEHQKLASLHYYAVHPTSYDNDRTITPDFTGLARERRTANEPDVLHAYFTECAGNIAAGKYNDGARENRRVLTDRIYRAIVQSEQQIERIAVNEFSWHTAPVTLPPREDISDEELWNILTSAHRSNRDRIQAAMQLSYRSRLKDPILLSRLSFGDAAHILHLPGESFIEYQLLAQSFLPSKWMAVASYGDCGPGYICLQRSFDEGGYEPTDSFVAGKSEAIMRQAITELLNEELSVHTVERQLQ